MEFDLMLVFLCIIVFVLYSITIYITEKKLKTYEVTPHIMEEFSTNIIFDEYPSNINMKNKYNCNVHTLKTCDIDNSIDVLSGCKEMRVECRHFKENTEYHENGEVVIIKKNKKENEGYALPIVAKVNGLCNAYHGSLVLVAANKEADSYMLICQCKNPGYIGNDEILGTCSTPRICNGKVNDLMKPLKEIECKCTELEKNKRYADGVPVCVGMTVQDANRAFNDWTDKLDWSNNPRTINIAVFNSTIVENMKIKKLLNPCQNSIIDMSIEIPNGWYNDELKSCAANSYGFPIVNGTLKQVDQPPIKYNRTIKTFDGMVHTGIHKSIRLSDSYATNNRSVVLHTTIPIEKLGIGYYKIAQTIGFGRSGQLLFPLNNDLVAGSCQEFNATYTCKYEKRNDLELYNEIPFTPYVDKPWWAIWGYETWEATYHMTSDGLDMHPYGATINTNNFNKRDDFRNFGVIWCNKDDNDGSCQNSVISFVSNEDYDKHKRMINWT